MVEGASYPAFSASHILISDWYGTSRLWAAILIELEQAHGQPQ